jgi:hypothetical protein
MSRHEDMYLKAHGFHLFLALYAYFGNFGFKIKFSKQCSMPRRSAAYSIFGPWTCLEVPIRIFFFFLDSLDVVRLSPLGTAATIWPIVPAPDNECGAVGGMRIDRGN